MGIIEELTPVYYKLNRLGIERDANGKVIVIGVMNIYNAAGKMISKDSPHAALNDTQRQMLANFVTEKLTAYESATGLTKLPQEPQE